MYMCTGVWDVHCAFEAGGAGLGSFPDLVSCSAHGNFFFPQYQCAQCEFQSIRGQLSKPFWLEVV